MSIIKSLLYDRRPLGFMLKISNCLSCRSVLWYLVFAGSGVNYMIRTNINIAIVAMVWSHDVDETQTIVVSECYHSDALQLGRMPSNFSNVSDIEQGDTKETKFDWDENQQGYVLGAFYWLYWLSQLPGGVLAQRYGFKMVFGFSNLFMCLITFLIPMFATLDPWALVLLRMIQGLIGGMAWPSIHVAAGNWSPPNERSKFMSSVMGSSVGAALTYPMCGLIIHSLGWKAVFHVTGAIGVVWFGAWWLFVFDTPAKHPHISKEELRYIESSLAGTVSKRKLPIPWTKILTSVPIWLVIMVSWSCLWGMFTLLTQAPTYFRYVHGWSIRMNGLLSGVPHICRVVLALILSYFCDTLLEKNILSPLAIRKIAAATCCLLQGVFFLGLAFSGCNSVAAVICLALALATTGAESAGPLANYVDLSPNFAGIVMGIGNMVTVTPGFISPIIVGALTYQNQSSSQWHLVFIIAAAMTFIPSMLFLCFGSSEVQPWNSSRSPVIEELETLDPRMLQEKYQGIKSKHKYPY